MSERRIAVIGGGNAALCAAISASENGGSVDLFERAPIELRGGNSRFTAGAFRTVYEDASQLHAIMPELTEDELNNTEFGKYTTSDFFDDLGRVTQYRSDPALAETLINESYPTLQWMREHGVRFLPLYGRQSFKVEGKQKFWGGLTVECWGGGEGLIDQLTRIATEANVQVHYGMRAVNLKRDSGTLMVRFADRTESKFDAVILACGGFESSPQMRARYLGPNWDLAKVRGTRFNTGDGISMAQQLGANTAGHWSGCHAVAWDLNAPAYGDLSVGDGFQKHSYPLGIMVNSHGRRFVDEGADFRNYTYAKYGREILNQPYHVAWQVFDAKVLDFLRDEYRIRQVTKAEADSIEALAEQMVGVDREGFVAEVSAFNQAVSESQPFNPAVKDGRRTDGLRIDKTNWANKLDEPPYSAFGVTCGITFTFGGLAVNSRSAVLNELDEEIPRLFAAGELVGGLYYHNYPGGTGLMAGSVFGRLAGLNACLDRN